MTTSTTAPLNFAHVTNAQEVSPVAMQLLAHQNTARMHSSPQGDRVVLKGKYVVSAEGQAAVIVSIDQKAFKRTMAVREINKQVEGRSSVDLDSVVNITLGR